MLEGDFLPIMVNKKNTRTCKQVNFEQVGIWFWPSRVVEQSPCCLPSLDANPIYPATRRHRRLLGNQLLAVIAWDRCTVGGFHGWPMVIERWKTMVLPWVSHDFYPKNTCDFMEIRWGYYIDTIWYNLGLSENTWKYGINPQVLATLGGKIMIN